MHQKAAASNIANAGIVICEPLKVVCQNETQFSDAYFETHIVGLAFVRFFLIYLKRDNAHGDIVHLAENIYFNTLSHHALCAAYDKRKETYYRLFLNCKTFRLDLVEDFFRWTVNGPGLELHQTILWIERVYKR